MAARASCSTPAQSPRRIRVRARFEKKVGSLGFLRILHLKFLISCVWGVESGGGARLREEILGAAKVALLEELVALFFQFDGAHFG